MAEDNYDGPNRLTDRLSEFLENESGKLFKYGLIKKMKGEVLIYPAGEGRVKVELAFGQKKFTFNLGVYSEEGFEIVEE